MAKRIMRQVQETYFAADGVTPLYGAGELVAEDVDLPAGVRTTDVTVDDGDRITELAAPVPAQAADQGRLEAERQAELTRVQTERSQPATDEAAAAELTDEQLGMPSEAAPGSLGASAQPGATSVSGSGTPDPAQPSGQGGEAVPQSGQQSGQQQQPQGQQPTAQAGGDRGQGQQATAPPPPRQAGTRGGKA